MEVHGGRAEQQAARPPLPFDLSYRHSSISSGPTLKLPVRALLCTCVNAVAMGSGKGEQELAEVGV